MTGEPNPPLEAQISVIVPERPVTTDKAGLPLYEAREGKYHDITSGIVRDFLSSTSATDFQMRTPTFKDGYPRYMPPVYDEAARAIRNIDLSWKSKLTNTELAERLQSEGDPHAYLNDLWQKNKAIQNPSVYIAAQQTVLYEIIASKSFYNRTPDNRWVKDWE